MIKENDVADEQQRDTWGEDPGFPVSDWKYEVANDDTRRGYWDWVDAKKEEDA